MMRLILAPNSTEGIEEKLLKSQEHKIWWKFSENHRKRKMGCTLGDKIQSQRSDILMKIKCLQDVETTQTSSHSLEDWGESLTISPLFLTFEAHTTPSKMKT
jgi:hypothetical protein